MGRTFPGVSMQKWATCPRPVSIRTGKIIMKDGQWDKVNEKVKCKRKQGEFKRLEVILIPEIKISNEKQKLCLSSSYRVSRGTATPVSHDSSGETSHNQEFLRVHRTRLKASMTPGGPRNPKVSVQPQTQHRSCLYQTLCVPGWRPMVGGGRRRTHAGEDGESLDTSRPECWLSKKKCTEKRWTRAPARQHWLPQPWQTEPGLGPAWGCPQSYQVAIWSRHLRGWCEC